MLGYIKGNERKIMLLDIYKKANKKILKYNRNEQRFKYCFVFYDDLTKQERHRVKIKLFMEDENEIS